MGDEDQNKDDPKGTEEEQDLLKKIGELDLPSNGAPEDDGGDDD